MKISNLKFQISLFGNYDEISPSVSTIKTFVELFEDKGLIPNQFQEININLTGDAMHKPGTISRLKLTSSDKSLNINFNADRIDFILNNINLGVFEMLDINAFTTEVEDIAQKIGGVFDKTHKRIGFVSSFLIDNIDLDEVQNRVFSNIPFFDDKQKANWTCRNAAIVNIEAEANEICNAVVNVNKIEANLLMNNENSVFNGILLNIDINTLAENSEYRFTKDNISGYIDKMLELQNIIFGEYLTKISGENGGN